MNTALINADTDTSPFYLSNVQYFSDNISIENDTEKKKDVFDDLEELKNPFPTRTVIKANISTNKNWSIVKPVFAYENPVHTHIKENMIDQITLRKRWEIEGIKPPNIFCMNNAKEICLSIYDKHKIIPKTIDASIEEGIYVLYLNTRNNRTLEIEIYNDLDVAAIVTDNNIHKIIASQDIEQIYFDSIIRFFYE